MKIATQLYLHLCSRRSQDTIRYAILTVGLIFAASTASAHDLASASTDAIIARKTVMNSLSDKMDDIEGMISSGKIDLATARADADTISVFLMAFPHLFPPATNQWKPNVARDPATDTFASPDIWIKFADFYKQSTAASKSAYNASRSQNENDLKAAIAQLRTQCNACHRDYLKQN